MRQRRPNNIVYHLINVLLDGDFVGIFVLSFILLSKLEVHEILFSYLVVQ